MPATPSDLNDKDLMDGPFFMGFKSQYGDTFAPFLSHPDEHAFTSQTAFFCSLGMPPMTSYREEYMSGAVLYITPSTI